MKAVFGNIRSGCGALYCDYLYPQFTGNYTVRRHKICVLLRCFDSMYARYMSFKRLA